MADEKDGRDIAMEASMNAVRMDTLICEQQYQRFAMLKPDIRKDGNQWSVLYGDNIQEGIVGYGDTPHEAIMDWDAAFNKKIIF